MPKTIVGLHKSGETCAKRDTLVAAAAADSFDYV